MTVGLFEQLFDLLDERLAEDPCDHSMRLTEEFLAECDLDTEEVLVWLAERGGTCDSTSTLRGGLHHPGAMIQKM